ncbi:hypothetical protein HDU76_002405 [Blyttiomyces sp. JEL0837]|nr:hypothetical protein HDU76_002405 [Blyttiomyces sp. JEL0837]
MNNFAQKEFYTIVAGASILAANAGFINVVAMAGVFSVTVSHVTGTVSRIGISLVQGDITTLSMVVSIILSFMFGAFIAGYMVGDHKFQLGNAYGYALMLESGMLFASFISLRRELIVGEWCAAFACGLQNAIATSYSGMVVRTTHMTGIATDIGNILGQACRTDSNAELWRLKVHVPIFFSYIFGGMMGQVAYIGMKEHSFLLPCFFTGAIACAYLSLPYIRTAAKVVQETAAMATGSNGPQVEYRIIGDPSKVGATQVASADKFAAIQGRDIDGEMRNLYSEMDAASGDFGEKGMSGFGLRRESVVRTAKLEGTGVTQGESVEELLVAVPAPKK